MNQKGFAPIFTIISLLVLTILAGSYFILRKPPINPISIQNSSKEQSRQSDSNHSCEYNDSDLCKFLEKQKQPINYVKKSTNKTTDSQGNSLTIEDVMKYDGKGNMYWTTFRNDKENFTQLFVDGKQYIKNGDDKGWIKITDAKPQSFGNLNEELPQPESMPYKEEGEEMLSDNLKTQYEKIGKESCETLQCFKYKITDYASKGNRANYTYIWFDDKDYLLRKTLQDTNGYIELFSYEPITILTPTPIIKEMTESEAFR